jgi:hypothetical protein
MEKFNPQVPLRYGIIAFAFILTIGLMMYVFYQAVVSSILMFGAIQMFSFALVLFLGIWSAMTYRRESGGVISFSHAFLAVFIVFVFNAVGHISSVLLVNKVVDKEYAEKASSLLKEKMTDYFEKKNMTDEQIKEQTDKMDPEAFDPPLTSLLTTFVYTLLFWSVIAAIVAAFIKRGSGDLIASGMAPEPIRTI